MSLISKLAAIIFTLVAVAVYATSADAYQCKKIGAIGVAARPVESQALSAAQSTWTNRVKSTLGLEWSVYSISSLPKESCEWTGDRYQCVVRAKPCKYVAP
jgi:hypothetical protein